MSLSGDTSDRGSLDFAEYPYKWVAVPICILLLASLAVTFLQYRKRQRQRNYMMNAFQREFDQIGPGQDRQSASNRWPWAADRPRNDRRAGTGVRRRAEEGLNELGEAPPAYAPPVKHLEEVELHDMAPSPVASHASATLPQVAPHAAGFDGATPPAYVEGQHSGSTPGPPRDMARPQYPVTPAPAVLPSR